MELPAARPRTWRELAHYRLPPRPSTRTLSIRRITSDTSGGVYFTVDERDRAVLGTAARRLEVDRARRFRVPPRARVRPRARGPAAMR